MSVSSYNTFTLMHHVFFPCTLPGSHTDINEKFDRLIAILKKKSCAPRFGLEDNILNARATIHDIATIDIQSTWKKGQTRAVSTTGQKILRARSRLQRTETIVAKARVDDCDAVFVYNLV